MGTTTQHYGLHQWAAEDDFLRTDFNEDNAKLDAALAGMPKIATGSYVGTGTYGYNNPNSITFPFQPKFVFLIANNGIAQPTFFLWNCHGATGYNSSGACPVFFTDPNGTAGVSYSGTTMTWFSPQNSLSQLNASGTTYTWFILG